MIKIEFPNNYKSENKDWIKNTIESTIESLSSTIKIYFKIKIKSCNIKLELIKNMDKKDIKQAKRIILSGLKKEKYAWVIGFKKLIRKEQKEIIKHMEGTINLNLPTIDYKSFKIKLEYYKKIYNEGLEMYYEL